MPIYKYKAKDNDGKIIEDVIQAGSKKEVVSFLKSEKVKVLTIRSIESKSGGSIFGSGISISEKATFCRFLATMLRSGLPLPEALDILRTETQSNKLKTILFEASFYVRKGENLSSVFGRYKSDFDAVFLTMVKAGEESGTLDKSFDYLAKQMLASYELTQKVRSAMMYPMVIVGAMIANAFIMLGFVLPKMSDVFLSLNVDLPPVTAFILQVGKSVGANLTLTFAVFFAFLFFILMLFLVRKSREKILFYFVKLPVVNKVIAELDTARFARTLSTLLKSGVPIIAALEVATDVISQPQLKRSAAQFGESVSKGKSLSDTLEGQKKGFPKTMIQTIKAGEKTGSLEIVLDELAAFYEMEVDYGLKKATALIEPLIMLVIGIAVGAMVVLLITPIYSIVGGLEGNV